MRFDENAKGGPFVVLSSGRRFYAGGYIGVDAFDPNPAEPLGQGSDGLVMYAYDAEGQGGALTPAEKQEIAEHMIGAWQEYLRRLDTAGG